MVLNALSQNTPIIIKWPCLISSYIEIIYLSVWHMNSRIAHTLNACYCIFISQNNVIISSMSNQFVYIWHKQSRKAKTKEKERTFQWNEVFFFVQTLSGYVIVCIIVIRIISAYELTRTKFPNIILFKELIQDPYTFILHFGNGVTFHGKLFSCNFWMLSTDRGPLGCSP